MSNEENQILFRLCERFGSLEQGVKDLGRNFDQWCKKFDGNGQPGRCALEVEARLELAARVQALEDIRKRAAWVGVLWKIVEGVMLVVGGALALGLLKHFLRWL